jgi:hypothetical protein
MLETATKTRVQNQIKDKKINKRNNKEKEVIIKQQTCSQVGSACSNTKLQYEICCIVLSAEGKLSEISTQSNRYP